MLEVSAHRSINLKNNNIIYVYLLFNLFISDMLEVSAQQEQNQQTTATRGASRRGVVVMDSPNQEQEQQNKGCC